MISSWGHLKVESEIAAMRALGSGNSEVAREELPINNAREVQIGFISAARRWLSENLQRECRAGSRLATCRRGVVGGAAGGPSAHKGPRCWHRRHFIGEARLPRRVPPFLRLVRRFCRRLSRSLFAAFHTHARARILSLSCSGRKRATPRKVE